MNYTLHKTKKGFLITSDEKPQIGDIVLEKLITGEKDLFEIHTLNDIGEDQLKVIAQQDKIDFSDLKEGEQKEIGWVNVEKLALEFGETYGNTYNGEIDFYSAGFQKAKELLSDRQFTLEDIYTIVNNLLGWLTSPETRFSQTTSKEKINEFIQSLLNKSWKIEIETEQQNLGEVFNGKSTNIIWSDSKPKLTPEGKIKILKLV